MKLDGKFAVITGTRIYLSRDIIRITIESGECRIRLFFDNGCIGNIVCPLKDVSIIKIDDCEEYINTVLGERKKDKEVAIPIESVKQVIKEAIKEFVHENTCNVELKIDGKDVEKSVKDPVRNKHGFFGCP